MVNLDEIVNFFIEITQLENKDFFYHQHIFVIFNCLVSINRQIHKHIQQEKNSLFLQWEKLCFNQSTIGNSIFPVKISVSYRVQSLICPFKTGMNMYLLCSRASSTPHRSINTQIMDNAKKINIRRRQLHTCFVTTTITV